MQANAPPAALVRIEMQAIRQRVRPAVLAAQVTQANVQPANLVRIEMQVIRQRVQPAGLVAQVTQVNVQPAALVRVVKQAIRQRVQPAVLVAQVTQVNVRPAASVRVVKQVTRVNVQLADLVRIARQQVIPPGDPPAIARNNSRSGRPVVGDLVVVGTIARKRNAHPADEIPSGAVAMINPRSPPDVSRVAGTAIRTRNGRPAEGDLGVVEMIVHRKKRVRAVVADLGAVVMIVLPARPDVSGRVGHQKDPWNVHPSQHAPVLAVPRAKNPMKTWKN
jgi:hypothetical protein